MVTPLERPFRARDRTHTDPSTRRVGPGTAPVRRAAPSLTGMRAVQITRFGGPEVMDVVDLADPTPSDSQELYEVSSAGVNFADTHHGLSSN